MLPKKGSRRVTVDGVVYRWRESHGHRYFEVRLELFETPGRLLTAEIAYRHLEASAPERVYRPVMTHRLLASIVGAAIEDGWRPAAEGPGFVLSAERTAALVDDYDYRWSKWIVRSGERYV